MSWIARSFAALAAREDEQPTARCDVPGAARKLIVRVAGYSAAVCCLVALPAVARTVIELQAPPGSVSFGTRVVVLANGNFVVTDPQASLGGARGAVHLYAADGTRLTTLRGPQDAAGTIGDAVLPLPDGRVVIYSPRWIDERGFVGAITVLDGRTGLDGAVDGTNSLIGSTNLDRFGNTGWPTLLDDGSLVFVFPTWDRGPLVDAGAVYVARPGTTPVGEVSVANAIVGSSAGDGEGMLPVVPLSGGRFAFSMPNWDASPGPDFGAVRIVGPGDPVAGVLDFSNALIGSSVGDSVGFRLRRLDNGRLVALSPRWDSPFHVDAGAITWIDPAAPATGTVTISNSWYGARTGERLGTGTIVPLRNGHYVLAMPDWPSGSAAPLGAVIWRNGFAPGAGAFTTTAALVGATPGDRIGSAGVSALANGNYVVASPFWSRATVANAGAATWADGAQGLAGVVSTLNSLYGGGSSGDLVASDGVVPLASGAFAVRSASWGGSGGVDAIGAVTLGSGDSPLVGPVDVTNSLLGPHPGARFGHVAVALEDGALVAGSPTIRIGSADQAGLLRRIPGNAPATGVVSIMGSAVGSAANERLGQVVPLAGGEWAIVAQQWGTVALESTGAVRWCARGTSCEGTITPTNALVGNQAGDYIAEGGLTRFGEGAFMVLHPRFQFPGNALRGATTVVRGRARPVGPVSIENSLESPSASAFDYDPARDQLVVGYIENNRVQIVRFAPDLLFRDGVECAGVSFAALPRLERCGTFD